MSVFPQFRDVSAVVWVGRRSGAEPPGVAQRPTGARNADGRNRTRFFDRAGVSLLGSQTSSADLEQTRVALITPAWSTATLRLTLLLLLANESERSAELFVFDHRSLRDLAHFVEGPIRQFDAAVTDCQRVHPKRGAIGLARAVKQTSGSLPDKGCALARSRLLPIAGKAIWSSELRKVSMAADGFADHREDAVLIGYARVSTEDQHLDLQRDALTRAGCVRTFEDRRSGAKSDRPGLAAALDYVRSGDSLVVWRLARISHRLVCCDGLVGGIGW